MFAKATRNFVRETDSGGDLIPVSQLNASDKLQLLSLVTKRKKFWCWQKPKYHFLAVSLSDVLTEDKPIKPVIVESDFAKYMGKFEDVVQGSIETSFGKINLGAGAKGCVESQSSFGNLRKQEVDLQQLMKDVKDRYVLQREVMSDSGSMMKDSSVILEIPPATTIAYGVIELFIKCDGQFEFCLLDEQQGGFERESTEGSTSPHSVLFRDASFLYHPDAVDNGMYSGAENPIPGHASLSVLKKGIARNALHDYILCFFFGFQLDALCTGDKPDLKELKPAQQQDLADFLQLVGCKLQQPALYCVHWKQSFPVNVSFTELSDYTLVLLRACSDLQVVPALCCLPYIASADGTLALSSPLVATLTDRGRFDVAQRLFASTNINLEKTESSVKAVTMREPRFFPLVLYVALCGLHSLGGTVEELF
uniref:Gasdermin E n=1 Tax=Pavo cristatus TaxID=9049 RepID=A0A8C9G772_PAVCR